MKTTTKISAGAVGALMLLNVLAPQPATAQSSRLVSSKISPPKLTSAKVTETQRVTTEVGRPRVIAQETRVAASVQRIPTSGVGARSAAAAANTAAVQRPTITRLVASAAAASTTTPDGQSYQAWRDLSRTQFRTGDFFERQ